jgi:RNA polymerase sigma factor (sigma-70 family)
MMAALASQWMTTGDSSSFETLFLTEYAKVVAIAYRVLGDAHEAEDVAQEVFCSFYRRHPADASYAGPWLYQAAAHAALNVIRGRRRREHREMAHATDRIRIEPANRDSLDPGQLTVEAEQREEVRAALGRLPAKSAAVLVLRYTGLSYAEVATALGVSPNGVGTLLRRAEAALRKEMNDATPK